MHAIPDADDSALIRAFFAVELTPALREGLALTLHRLRFAAPRVAWTPPVNLHITLLFLGDSPSTRLAELMRRIRQHPAPPAFSCAVTGLGAFGPARSPRVIWAGVTDPEAHFRRLIEFLRPLSESLGWPPEGRDFHPHITLGRVKPGAHDPSFLRALERTDEAHWGILPVHRVVLMQSRLSPTGAHYSILDEFTLTTAPAESTGSGRSPEKPA